MEASTSSVSKEEAEMASPESTGDKEEEIITQGVSWCAILATRSDGDQYSPARDLSDKECLHGAGQYVCSVVWITFGVQHLVV
jgi:hypothetical protein